MAERSVVTGEIRDLAVICRPRRATASSKNCPYREPMGDWSCTSTRRRQPSAARWLARRCGSSSSEPIW